MAKHTKKKKKISKKKLFSENKKIRKQLDQVTKVLSKVTKVPNLATADKSDEHTGSSGSSSSSSSATNTAERSGTASSDSSQSASKPTWAEFVKVRERSFESLQSVIRDNWNQNTSIKLTADEILDVALMIEQRALLACMQTDIYCRAMSATISGLQEACLSKQRHPQLENIITRIWERHKRPVPVKLEKNEPTSSTEISVVDSTNQIPAETIVPKLTSPVSSQQGAPIPIIPSCRVFPVPQVIKTLDTQSDLPPLPSPVQLSRELNYWESSAVTSDINQSPSQFRNPSPILPDNLGPSTNDLDPSLLNSTFEEAPAESSAPQEMDCVTSTTNAERQVPPNENQEEDIDNLMRILHGIDDDDAAGNNDTENRCDLDSRLEEMLGEPRKSNSEFGEMFRDDLTGKRGSQFWLYERYIFMYRMTAVTSLMGRESLARIRKTLHRLFGSDSDDENEDKFCDYDKFTVNCVRRVLPTVAKYLTPYQQHRRISQGSLVFKNLVRKVAESLVDFNYYPNDREIRKFVDMFFPPNQKYLTVGDVWSFVLEEDDLKI